MTVSPVDHLLPQHMVTARCLFAIELSKQSWVIRFITPLSAKINRRILSGGDWRGLLELIERDASTCQPRDGSGGRNPASGSRTETSRLRPRHVTPELGQAYEPEVPVVDAGVDKSRPCVSLTLCLMRNHRRNRTAV